MQCRTHSPFPYRCLDAKDSLPGQHIALHQLKFPPFLHWSTTHTHQHGASVADKFHLSISGTAVLHLCLSDLTTTLLNVIISFVQIFTKFTQNFPITQRQQLQQQQLQRIIINIVTEIIIITIMRVALNVCHILRLTGLGEQCTCDFLPVFDCGVVGAFMLQVACRKNLWMLCFSWVLSTWVRNLKTATVTAAPTVTVTVTVTASASAKATKFQTFKCLCRRCKMCVQHL